MSELEVLGMTRDELIAGADTAALVIGGVGALIFGARHYFRKILANIAKTNDQVVNGHGSTILRDDIDTIIAGQRAAREDLVALRGRVDDGFKRVDDGLTEVRKDIRTLQTEQSALRDKDDELSVRMLRLETPPPVAVDVA